MASLKTDLADQQALANLKGGGVHPPLGVMPRNIWLEHRIRELSEAITRQLSTPGHRPSMDLADEWGHELVERQAEHRLGRINQDVSTYRGIPVNPQPGRYE